MTQAVLVWTASSALLILAVAALRALLGRRMGAGVKYALWGVVLLRLLVPVQLFTVPVPVPVPERNVPQAMETPRPSAALTPGQIADAPAITGPLPGDTAVNVTTVPGPVVSEAASVDLPKLLGWLWLAGSVVTAAAFLASNVSFARRLRRIRQDLQGTDCALPVYIAGALPSPCLFGLFRPAVYVTPSAAADPNILRHVLAHEYTHFRHGDHIWNVLRGAALALHWWNPLVWLAAALSRRDCELACDEGTLKRLGEGERFAYGRTLLTLVTAQTRPADLLSCATTMTGDGRSVAQRVKRIARAPKRWLWAAALAVLLTVALAACAFGQGEEAGTDPSSDGPQLPWAEGADSLRYVRDKGGFPDEFAIRLDKDGTFLYYEGALSSTYGRGTWTQEGNVICLVEDYDGKHHYFTLEEDALVFRAEEPERFVYLEVADGERFSLTSTGTDPDGTEAASSGSPTPAPSDPAAPEPVYTFANQDMGYVQITGLDCGGAAWMRSNGWEIHSPFDQSKSITTSNDQLGFLQADDPRFLGGPFGTPGTLFALYAPNGDSPWLYLLYGDLAYNASTVFAIEATVDLDSGAVTEKHGRDAEGRELALDDGELTAAARTLAGLIQGAAEYYDQALAAAPVVTDLSDFSGPMPDDGQTFVLTYKGKETRFNGYWYHMPERAQTLGTLIDLDGGGKDEIVVILPEGGGTGAWSDGLYVFDGDTLEQFDTAGVAQMILDSIRSTGDAENFYLTGPGGLNVAISKEDVRRGYEYGDIPMDDTLALGNIVEFRVENGAVHCDLPCSSYQTDNYIGTLDATLSFSRTDGFRCVKAEYLPYKDSDPAASDKADEMSDKMGQTKEKTEQMQRKMERAQDMMDQMQDEMDRETDKMDQMVKGLDAAQYYKAGSLPLFELAFSRLDNVAVQSGWLNKLYEDGDTAFFSAAVRGLDEKSPLLDGLAEQAYTDDEIAFFSILADRMDEGEWTSWLDRALADGKWDFQSMLSDRLGMGKEKDAKEEEWARRQTAEYQAVGVTVDGKNYYYQGQLVNIFLDIRANGSFYTLDTNPAGAVNIKVLRDGNDNITGAAYMTEAEAAELLNDMRGE